MKIPKFEIVRHADWNNVIFNLHSELTIFFFKILVTLYTNGYGLKFSKILNIYKWSYYAVQIF